MESHSHHNTALYYIWENNSSSPSACFFDLQKGDICVLGRNDGYKVIYIDNFINGSSSWGDYHVIDTLTEYNLNLPKEHEILCQVGTGNAVGNKPVIKKLIEVCRNEWVKDFFAETESILNGIADFWNVKQLIRLTGDYDLMYFPIQKAEEERIVDESASTMHYIPEVESLGSELITRNVSAGDYCICKKGNGALFLRIDHSPSETDIYSSFGLIEEVDDTDIMFPLVYLQLCKKGVKKEKNVKFLNRFNNAFARKESKNIIDICIRIAHGENVSLPSFNFVRDWDVEPDMGSDIGPEEYFGQQVELNNTEYVSQNVSAQKTVCLFDELPENVRLDIEIQYLKSIRKQDSTRSLFRKQYPNVNALYQFALDSKSQKDNLPEELEEVYLELLKSVRAVLNASDYNDSIKMVFRNAVADFTSSKRKNAVVQKKTIDLSLSNNRKGSRWTKEEEEIICNLYKDGVSPKDIAISLGRSENSICMRLDKLGLIVYSYETGIIEKVQSVDDEQTNIPDYSGLYVENSFSIGTLYDKSGNLLFSDTGKLKIINGAVYRFNRKSMCFTVKKVEHTKNNKWQKSAKLLVAYDASDLYEVVKRNDYIDKIESFYEDEIIFRNTIKVDGEVFDYYGNYINNVEDSGAKTEDKGCDDIEVEHVYLDKYGKVISKSEFKYNHKEDDYLSADDDANNDLQLDEHVYPSKNVIQSETEESKAYNAALKDIQEEVASQSKDLYSNAMVYIPTDAQFESKDKQFVPKGQLKNIACFAKDFKDILWLVSFIDIVEKERLSESFTLEQIASMEIANIWEILRYNSSIDIDGSFKRCIDYLASELNLSKDASKIEIYKAIKDFPISGEYEELIDILSEDSHFNLIKAWINNEDKDLIVTKSEVFSNSCLYSISESKYETIIKINPSWRYYIINNRERLKHFLYSFNSSLKFFQIQ